MADSDYHKSYYERNKEKILARAKARYDEKKQDPAWMEEKRAKQRVIDTARRADPEKAEKMREASRKSWAKPENNAKGRARNKKWKQENPERVSEYSKEWKEKNVEHIKDYNKKHAKERWQDPEFRSMSRERQLKNRYNLSLSEFNEMWLSQGGRCCVCEVEMQPAGVTDDSVVVDHNHDTGEVRGLLCRLCNRGLGVFKDNPYFLHKAALYLEERGDYSQLNTLENN
jgi:hypothetical protein